jgi:uncharacterized membrane protein
MAGIGFELRKLLRTESFLGLIRGYGYAGLISSGPWVFSIVGVLLIGVLRAGGGLAGRTDAFLVAITYLMATSLILTGALQLFFSRFVADREFDKRHDDVLPNLVGALALTTVVSGSLATAVLVGAFDGSWLYRLLLLGSFVVLCDLWLLVVMLSGLKEYRWVLAIFFLGYALTVALSLSLQGYGMEGLLGGFFAGQVWMMLSFLALVARRYPAGKLVSFGFVTRKKSYPGLLLVGLSYNLGTWVDKFLFWYHPHTSEPVLGPLRASLLYDLPMFLAYLSIVPGMAVFLVRIETDFAECHARFYEAVRTGAPYSELERLKSGMVEAIRQGIYEVFKVQGLTALFLILAGPRVLRFFGLSLLHGPLYAVDLVAVGAQVLLLAILNVFFYLDQRGIALGLSVLLLVSNAAFSYVTILLGPPFYGYGFGLAVFLTGVVGLALLSRKLERLEYETFMLQG